MDDLLESGSARDTGGIREAVCIHTRKIFDSCRDKDCIEDLRLYPAQGCQAVIDRAISVKAGSAELLYAYIDVEPVSFNRGFYTVDVRYFYKITADAFVGAARPVTLTGLVVYDKRAIMFGSEGSAKVFSSGALPRDSGCQDSPASNLPTAVLEAVDPLILGIKIIDQCDKQCCGMDTSGVGLDIPYAISSCFPEGLDQTGSARRILITLGQFSIIRLERDSQLLIPAYDYCVPQKECPGCREEDPCSVFRKVQFPLEEFFPPNTSKPPEGYQDTKNCCVKS